MLVVGPVLYKYSTFPNNKCNFGTIAFLAAIINLTFWRHREVLMNRDLSDSGFVQFNLMDKL